MEYIFEHLVIASILKLELLLFVCVMGNLELNISFISLIQYIIM